MTRNLSYASATTLVAELKARRVGSLELLEHFIARIDRLNKPLNAIVAFDLEGARARARQADAAIARGETRGPLHGLPMTVKDTFEVVGMSATAGAPHLKNHRPEQNAEVVQRVVDAGAIVFGKTNAPLWAGDHQSYNDIYGTSNNPWNLERTPGGSSGGAAAAVAAGFTPLEIGSDIGGSIRVPAHCCGVYGLKPSWNIVPLRGHIPPPPGAPYSPPDIAVAGPLARSAGDLELALSVMAGADQQHSAGWRLELPAPRPNKLREYRIAAWLDDPAIPTDDEVRSRLEAVCDALDAAGCNVDRNARPAINPARVFTVYLRLLFGVIGPGMSAQSVDNIRKRTEGMTDADQSVAADVMRGVLLSHRDWVYLNAERAAMRAAWAAFFKNYDVLLCPNFAVTAFPHDHLPDQTARTHVVNGNNVPYLQALSWPGLTGVAYLPATAAPVGLTAQGLPVGVQIVGPFLGDRTTIAFAAHLAEVVGGFEAPPGYD